MNKNNIEFWFEFGSTYSYPAAMRIEALAAKYDVQVVWRSFLLGPIFKEQGWNNSPFTLFPAKGRYMWRDIERICIVDNIPFQRPSEFPRNGLLAARIACYFADALWLPDFVRAIYQANFQQDKDISTTEVVKDCLIPLCEKPDIVIAKAQSTESKKQLFLQTEQAIKLGIFGAPSLVVEKEIFWGNDRLETALSWVTSS